MEEQINLIMSIACDQIKEETEMPRNILMKHTDTELTSPDHVTRDQDPLQTDSGHVETDLVDGDSDDDLEDELNGTDTENKKNKLHADKKGWNEATEQKESAIQKLSDIIFFEKIKDSEKKYFCAVCQKGFTSKAGVKFHCKYQHTEASLFCLDCRKPFRFQTDLDRHMLIHNGERPWICDECHKGFVCKSSLMQHKKFQHTVGRTIACGICDKSFCTENDLKRHLFTHTGTKPYMCEVCMKTYSCKSSFNAHKRVHDGKTLDCELCDMKFYYQSDLRRHTGSKHTGERPWKCSECAKSYSCKSALKAHERNTHSVEKLANKLLKVKSKIANELLIAETHLKMLEETESSGHSGVNLEKTNTSDISDIILKNINTINNTDVKSESTPLSESDLDDRGNNLTENCL